jgi:serine/threonine protein phosphatase PrpC
MKDPTHDSAGTRPFALDAMRGGGRSLGGFVVDAAGLSHAGVVRSRNEDHFVVARVARSLECLATSIPESDRPAPHHESARLLVVADGMGGHAAGEVASRRAICALLDLLVARPDWIMRLDDQTIERVTARATRYYEQVNAVLVAEAAADPRLAGMGTTLTGAYVAGDAAFLAHVGDSRAYLQRDGQLHQLTRDHTHVQTLVDRGLLTREQAASHGLRHVLANALGARADAVQVEVHAVPLAVGDRLLLATDGLTEVVPDETIATCLEQAADAVAACRRLTDLALAGGAPDNVTVVVARFLAPA